MAICPGCGTEIPESSRFCPECGAALERASAPVPAPVPIPDPAPAAESAAPDGETVLCINCGSAVRPVDGFCPECGAALNGGADAPPEEPPKKEKKPFPLKKLVFGVGGLVAVAALVFLAVTLLGRGGGRKQAAEAYPAFAVYVRDKQLWYSDLRGDPQRLTDRLLDERDADNRDYQDYGDVFAAYVALSADGKTIFYPDRMNDGDIGATVYYRSLAKKNADPVKLDSDVLCYCLSEKGDRVVYLRDGGNLYEFSLKKEDKEKLSGNVVHFWAADDCGCVVFLNEDGALFSRVSGKEAEKLDGKIGEVCFVSADARTVVYLKDGTLYRSVQGREREKLDSGVGEVLVCSDEGEIYYIRDLETHTLSDFVEDDMADADAAAPDSAGKADRDRLREALRGEDDRFLIRIGAIWYYDGKESAQLAEQFFCNGSHAYSAEAKRFACFCCDPDELARMRLSELEDVYSGSLYSVFYTIRDTLQGGCTLTVFTGDEAQAVELEDPDSFCFGADGRNLWIRCRSDELYRLELGGSGKKPTLYAEDVYDMTNLLFDGSVTEPQSGQLLYLAEADDDGEAELYAGKTRIDSDVMADWTYYFGFRRYDPGSGRAYYFVDWNRDREYGTLKAWQKGKPVRVADDVYRMQPAGDGVLYLTDYNTDRCRGDLYFWNGRQSERLDEDVVALLLPQTGKYRFYFSYLPPADPNPVQYFND